jgi:hypothetical protein
MIELKSDTLVVSFPEMPLQPTLSINFQRTLRIPDDGGTYPLPPGFGSFPLRHIDDHGSQVPSKWLKRGGVLLPMWQSEALWLYFNSRYLGNRETAYPFAVKVATGKVNAITGELWQRGLSRNPQNYLVVPEQPWLDGYCVEKGIVRQFVAMPLGEGYSAEEQITGEAEFGGMQIEILPMRSEVFERRFPIHKRQHGRIYAQFCSCASLAEGVGLAPGGRMRQEIYEDPFSIHDWDTERSSRCFIHLVNATTWHAVTGQQPPSKPISAEQYTKAGFPWFDYYDADSKALNGSSTLGSLKTVKEKAVEKRSAPLAENQSLSVTNIVSLRAGLERHQVREAEL